MPWEQELLQHMDLQLTEAPAEGDLLRRGDALLAEHQHMVVQVRPVDTAEVLGGQGQPRSRPSTSAPNAASRARICRERRRALAPEGKRTSLTPRKPGHAGHEIPRKAAWIRCGAPIGRQVRESL